MKVGDLVQIITEETLKAISKLNLPARFRNKLQQDIDYLLNKCYSDLLEIRVFGSCATGQYRASSDIDLLIITKELISDRFLRGEIQEALDEPLDGVTTDVVFYTMDSYLKSQDIFSSELRKYSLIIWKRS